MNNRNRLLKAISESDQSHATTSITNKSSTGFGINSIIVLLRWIFSIPLMIALIGGLFYSITLLTAFLYFKIGASGILILYLLGFFSFSGYIAFGLGYFMGQITPNGKYGAIFAIFSVTIVLLSFTIGNLKNESYEGLTILNILIGITLLTTSWYLLLGPLAAFGASKNNE